jgi:hypothetical protein
MSKNQSSYEAGVLRPEARPFGWYSLNDTQKDAFTTIIGAMHEAVQGIDQTQKQRETVSTIDKFRSSQTILLTGARGTGKTSLLLSLQHCLQDWEGWMAEGETQNDAELKKRLPDRFDHRVVWLETLDLEPLPEQTNLLAAILARIEQAVSQPAFGGDMPMGMLNPQAPLEEALRELRGLATDAAIAWDGNTTARGAQIDPDTYAVESLRAEHARLSLNSRLNKALNNIAKVRFSGSKVTSPLFVLPVDDLDLNPARCLDLLRLVRAISIQRLFVLILGDVELVESVVRYKMAGDRAAAAHLNIGIEELETKGLFQEIRGVAAQAVRKLLPPAQRVALYNYLSFEALQYRPASANSGEEKQESLAEVLRRCRIRVELPYLTKPVRKAELGNGTLGDFLLATYPYPPVSKGKADSRDNSFFYGAIELLAGPPREMADMWFVLHGQPQSPDRILRLAHRWFLEAVNSDTTLPWRERRRMSEAVLQLPDGSLEFHTAEVRVKWLTSKGQNVLQPPVNDSHEVKHEAEVSAQQTGSWEPTRSFMFRRHLGRRFSCAVPEPVSDRKSSRPDGVVQSPALELRTSAYLTLLHDLISLNPSRQIADNWLVPDVRDLELANVWWYFKEVAIDVPWPGVAFRSFWEIDLFCRAWNDVRDWPETQNAGAAERLRFMAYHWIRISCGILSGKPVMAPGQGSISEALVDTLSRDVAEMLGLQCDGRWRRERSLVSIAVLLSPESGIPEEFARPFWQNPQLSEFWRAHASEIRRARGRSMLRPRGPQQVLEEALLLVSPRLFLCRVIEEVLDSEPDSAYLRAIRPRIFALVREWESFFANKPVIGEEALISLRQIIASTLRPPHGFRRTKTHPGPSGPVDLEELLLQKLEPYGLLPVTMLHHPANSLYQGVLCPDEDDIQG